MGRSPRVLISLRKESKQVARQQEVPFRHSEELSEEEARHLLGVLRRSPGDRIELLDLSEQLVLQSTIESIDGNTINLLSEVVGTGPESLPKLRILLGVPKFTASEILVEKCSELGVFEIIFFPASRSQAPGKIDWDKKLPRLERIARESAKQSESLTVPRLSTENSLKSAALRATGMRFVLSPDRAEFGAIARPTPLSTALSPINSGALPITTPSQSELQGDAQDADFSIVVGPEGGLTAEEVGFLIEQGFQAVSLGQRILRVETAVIAASAIILQGHPHRP